MFVEGISGFLIYFVGQMVVDVTSLKEEVLKIDFYLFEFGLVIEAYGCVIIYPLWPILSFSFKINFIPKYMYYIGFIL